MYSAKPRALSDTTANIAVVEDLLPSERTLRTPTMGERWVATRLTVMSMPRSQQRRCDRCACLCAELESSVITQSSLPQLAAQPAPSIMRKRGYEHINGVEGELRNYYSCSCMAVCRGITCVSIWQV